MRSSRARRSSKEMPRVEAMDRLDAELLGDELADEGEGLLGGGVGAAGRRADLVAVGCG